MQLEVSAAIYTLGKVTKEENFGFGFDGLEFSTISGRMYSNHELELKEMNSGIPMKLKEKLNNGGEQIKCHFKLKLKSFNSIPVCNNLPFLPSLIIIL